MEYSIRCTKCKKVADDCAFRCKRCNSILEVVYPAAKISKGKIRPKKERLERYLDFLPLSSIGASLGEGKTPLKKFKTGILLKLETTNPTKTFKDRGSAIEISKAVELGIKQVCCASTGNMGLSIAYYAKKKGIRCTIFISSGANPMKMAKIARQGARIVKVNGDFNTALNGAEKFARKSGAFVCGDYHFRKEGQKTVGFEIVEQLKYSVPDYIFMPVGNGTLFSGVYKGLNEFKMAGIIKKLPKLVAVQSERCDPIVKAYDTDKPVHKTKADTEADAIAVGYPTFGFETLDAIKKTRGYAIGVAEKEIEDAVRLLEKSKVYCELGGGTGYAGLLKAYKQKGEKGLQGKNVVVVITGNNEGIFK